MNDFGQFLTVDGFESTGECHLCEKRGLPTILLCERYFGDGALGYGETAHICERCIDQYVHHSAEVLQHELRAMFARRSKVKQHV